MLVIAIAYPNIFRSSATILETEKYTHTYVITTCDLISRRSLICNKSHQGQLIAIGVSL